MEAKYRFGPAKNNMVKCSYCQSKVKTYHMIHHFKKMHPTKIVASTKIQSNPESMFKGDIKPDLKLDNNEINLVRESIYKRILKLLITYNKLPDSYDKIIDVSSKVLGYNSPNLANAFGVLKTHRLIFLEEKNIENSQPILKVDLDGKIHSIPLFSEFIDSVVDSSNSEKNNYNIPEPIELPHLFKKHKKKPKMRCVVSNYYDNAARRAGLVGADRAGTW